MHILEFEIGKRTHILFKIQLVHALCGMILKEMGGILYRKVLINGFFLMFVLSL